MSNFSLNKIFTTFLLALPVLLIIVPTSWVESLPSVCLFKAVFGVECLGCGITRALSHLFHGNFDTALQYNPRVIVAFPLLCYLYCRYLVKVIVSNYKYIRANRTGRITTFQSFTAKNKIKSFPG